MKVIAQTNIDQWSRDDNRWLVEVSETELNHISGHEYGRSIDVKVGTEIKVSDVFRVANKVVKEADTVKRVTGSLRAVADLLESVEPTIQQVVANPAELEAEQT